MSAGVITARWVKAWSVDMMQTRGDSATFSTRSPGCETGNNVKATSIFRTNKLSINTLDADNSTLTRVPLWRLNSAEMIDGRRLAPRLGVVRRARWP